MSGKILIAYASNAGSTAEIAEKIGEHLRQNGTQVDVKPLSEATNPGSYDAVIVGAPMIVGWHREATSYLKTHESALKQKPTAYFITSLELTRTGSTSVNGAPLYLDPKHGHVKTGKLGPKAKNTTETHYVQPILNAAPGVKPVSVAIFGGKLDYSVLGLLPKLFVKILIRGKEGDYRNWDAIREWAAQVGPALTK